jgi:hypothetical protein
MIWHVCSLGFIGRHVTLFARFCAIKCHTMAPTAVSRAVVHLKDTVTLPLQSFLLHVDRADQDPWDPDKKKELP